MSDALRSTLHAQGRLRGNLALEGDLTLTGAFSGAVTITGELEIAAGAQVSGTVEAGSLVVAGQVASPEEAAQRARRYASVFDAPFALGGRDLPVTVSIGVAESNGRQDSPELVVQAADRALYRAKDAGRNRVES